MKLALWYRTSNHCHSHYSLGLGDSGTNISSNICLEEQCSFVSPWLSQGTAQGLTDTWRPMRGTTSPPALLFCCSSTVQIPSKARAGLAEDARTNTSDKELRSWLPPTPKSCSLNTEAPLCCTAHRNAENLPCANFRRFPGLALCWQWVQRSFYCQERICNSSSLGISHWQLCFFCLTDTLSHFPSVEPETGAKMRTKFRDSAPDLSQALDSLTFQC